jgi:hypothetical protein
MQVELLVLLELDPPSKLCCMGVTIIQGVNRDSPMQLPSNVMSCKSSNANSSLYFTWPFLVQGSASSYTIRVGTFALR